MLVPEIKSNLVNKIMPDAFGRVSAVLLMHKPVGVTSHDVVAKVRKILRTKRVGHAGALDPFADGLLLVLVGKFTRYTEALIALDKSYTAGVVLGLQTDTQDPEGQILRQSEITNTTHELLQDKAALEKFLQEEFQPGYEQLVPIYSSVKVNGEKLRNLARSADEIQFLKDDSVEFTTKSQAGNPKKVIVKLPRKPVRINRIELNDLTDLTALSLHQETVSGKFKQLQIEVDCSKGTYIRQLAEDIGALLGLPSFLYSLTRTRVGEFSLADAVSETDLEALAHRAGIQSTPAPSQN